ncbi:MAG: hypothetical protein KC516_01470 [Nanoarchaeota archaeon]|nr:hypothetical protein [Nanoarchaeota archaeon]
MNPREEMQYPIYNDYEIEKKPVKSKNENVYFKLRKQGVKDLDMSEKLRDISKKIQEDGTWA